MKLSIIVPVYNMAADGKLEYCLESLVHQTLEDYEIIAVDDASTDESPQILRKYKQAYPGLFRAIFSPENRRQGGAKNLGLDAARGDYIGFMDSDDWADPEMYRKLTELALATGADMVGCDFCLTSEHSMVPTQRIPCNRPEQRGVLTDEKYRSLILDSGSLVVKIYARRLFEEPELRFPEHMFYEDNAVATALMLRAKHFEYLEEPLYFYYQHQASTVHTITQARCRDRMEAMRCMLRSVTKEQEKKFFPELEFRFLNLFYQNTLFSYLQSGGKRNVRFLKELAEEMKATFPEFQNNPYYMSRVPQEERRWIALHQKSQLLFLIKYDLVQAVRKWKTDRPSGC